MHTASADTPSYLIPQMGVLPVSDATHFVTAHLIAGNGSSKPKVFSRPLKLASIADAQLPATGVLLTHEQGWYARGLALGNLLHSITLAPGEVTQVAVVEWDRDERGSAQETTDQDDRTSADDQRRRSVDEVQQSTLRERQSGASFATTDSSDNESGWSMPIWSSGSGSNTVSGVSTNYTDGTRDLSLSENQKINDATVRNAQASRSRRASVVRETSQSESENLTTRVVANYNHAHAMTMMYFEVIEVYDLTTRVVDAERLIYLPMEVAEIDEDLLVRFGPLFARAARSTGKTALAEQIDKWIASRFSSRGVAAGVFHSLELKDDGTVKAWGRNDNGQTDVPLGLKEVIAVEGSGDNCLALKSDGTVAAWGSVEHSVYAIPPGLTGVTAIAAGWAHCLALKRDGTVVCWGNHDCGITTVPTGLAGVTSIAAGGSHCLVVKNDGTVAAWGDNRDGQTTIPEGLKNVVAVSAGGHHSLALKTDGTVVAWGSDSAGQGNVPDGLTGVTAIAAGYDHSLALKADGTVVAWGKNDMGQTSVPRGLKGVVAIAAGHSHNLALIDDGSVVGWGRNEDGESTAVVRPASILAQLNREKLFYNQLMWVTHEPGAVIESLRDLKWPSDATRALSDLVDPRPVTIAGNSVGYRWHFESERERKDFLKDYIDAPESTDKAHSTTVAVATGGVFGEAVLGQAVSAEKIDLTRFWKWQDSPIPILPSGISPLSAGGRARDVNTSTGQLSESAARLDPLVALPDPAGLSAASQMMTSSIFRDLSGSSVVQALALDASKHAADGADNATKVASQNFSTFMGVVKDLGMAALQKGGLDSTTLGGMQADPSQEGLEAIEDGGGGEGLTPLAEEGGGGAGGAAEGLAPIVEEAATALPLLAL